MASAVDVLARQWNRSGERLARRLDGLGDDEFFWQPVPECWTLRPQPHLEGRMQIDYEIPAPDPPPFTTIAWRLVHLANGNWIYWEHAYGARRRSFVDLDVPDNADDTIQYWLASRKPVTEWLNAAAEDDLDELRPSHLGEPLAASAVVMILLDEEVHHGAEIGVLRDLFAR